MNAEPGQNHDERSQRLRSLIASARGQTDRANKGILSDCSPDPKSAAKDPQAQPNGLPGSDRPLVRIPGYDLLGEIHRGGQGVVYEAFQRSTRRQVAIKVMREGPFAGLVDRTRFEREVTLLASLSHPNIVAVHDSGHVAGHDYFVMDRIEGQPLDRFVAAMRTGRSMNRTALRAEIPAIARLFTKICNGVNAAHLRGVIHRDLKPGNILVDAAGEPHILDFGLAKRHDSADARTPTMTISGQFVGSLPWSSPEQTQGGAVDVRTDVYALGVMLYQALTGRFPYPVEGSIDATLDSIRSVEPVRPRSVSRDVDADLERIVLKCLTKAREGRYQSAGELGRDIERYLHGEPIEARRESALYVLRKALRRYRLATVLALGIIVLVTAFAAAMAVQTRRVAWERDRAESQRRRALHSEAFLQSMFESVAPEGVPATDVSVRTILDDGSARVDTELAEWPEEAAAIHETLGDAYDKLGYFNEGEHHLRRSLEIRRRLLGQDHELVFRSLSELALIVYNQQKLSDAEGLFREAIELGRRILDPSSDAVVRMSTELGTLLADARRFSEAEAISRDALRCMEEKGESENPNALTARRTLARCLNRTGRTPEALALLRENEDIILRTRGPANAHYEGTLVVQAEVLESMGEIDQAERLLRRLIELRTRRIGSEHPALAWNQFCLARVLFEHRNEHREAEFLVRRALAIQTARKGPYHADVADCEQLLSRILGSAEQNDVRPSASK